MDCFHSCEVNRQEDAKRRRRAAEQPDLHFRKEGIQREPGGSDLYRLVLYTEYYVPSTCSRVPVIGTIPGTVPGTRYSIEHAPVHKYVVLVSCTNTATRYKYKYHNVEPTI